MALNDSRLTFLFDKYITDNASEEELKEFFSYILEAREDAALKERIISFFKEVQLSEEDAEKVGWDAIFRKAIAGPGGQRRKKPVGLRRMKAWQKAAAVLLILFLGGAAYRYSHRAGMKTEVAKTKAERRDILPGGNRATLTLSNGATVVLDSASVGSLASQGGVNIVKISSGLLAYQADRGAGAPGRRGGRVMQYNTLTTPRGGQYRLTLSDGTKVWLNSASSIRYPPAFAGAWRTVEITGEVYFEVKHDEDRPFRVVVGDQVIEDLGTRFDVNAYGDEPAIKATLLEGAIQIGGAVLKPGQQAVIAKDGKINVTEANNPDDAIAWTEGFFAFDDDNLQTVMRKLSRWYDIDVVYQPGAENVQRFSGRIDRNLTLAQILDGLKQTRAHFRIEPDRKVVILK